MAQLYRIGMVGLGVMGRNFVLNMADHGFSVAGYDKNLYLWDYDFPFSPNGQPPWPQFHHDAQRTGLASNPAFAPTEIVRGW